jgi:hypothetical protein
MSGDNRKKGVRHSAPPFRDESSGCGALLGHNRT